MLGDSDLAQDAVQEALIAAWRDLRALRDLDRFRPWLRRILVNSVYRAAKNERRASRVQIDAIADWGYARPGSRSREPRRDRPRLPSPERRASRRPGCSPLPWSVRRRSRRDARRAARDGQVAAPPGDRRHARGARRRQPPRRRPRDEDDPMTERSSLDRELTDYLDGRSTNRAPAGLLETTLARVETTRQRPAWLLRRAAAGRPNAVRLDTAGVRPGGAGRDPAGRTGDRSHRGCWVAEATPAAVRPGTIGGSGRRVRRTHRRHEARRDGADPADLRARDGQLPDLVARRHQDRLHLLSEEARTP